VLLFFVFIITVNFIPIVMGFLVGQRITITLNQALVESYRETLLKPSIQIGQGLCLFNCVLIRTLISCRSLHGRVLIWGEGAAAMDAEAR
jgi:hypothetical protein